MLYCTSWMWLRGDNRVRAFRILFPPHPSSFPSCSPLTARFLSLSCALSVFFFHRSAFNISSRNDRYLHRISRVKGAFVTAASLMSDNQGNSFWIINNNIVTSSSGRLNFTSIFYSTYRIIIIYSVYKFGNFQHIEITKEPLSFSLNSACEDSDEILRGRKRFLRKSTRDAIIPFRAIINFRHLIKRMRDT